MQLKIDQKFPEHLNMLGLFQFRLWRKVKQFELFSYVAENKLGHLQSS
jgi:hypothetical protein